MTETGLASIAFLIDPHYWAGIATVLTAVAAVYFVWQLTPRREAVPEAPPSPSPGSLPGHRKPSPLPARCADNQEALTSTTGDRRKHPRRGGKPIPIDLLIGDDDPAQLAFFVDVSEGGLRLKTATPVPVGTVLLARPADASVNEPWVTAKVRWSSTNEGVYDIGCEFTEKPQGTILLLFG